MGLSSTTYHHEVSHVFPSRCPSFTTRGDRLSMTERHHRYRSKLPAFHLSNHLPVSSQCKLPTGQSRLVLSCTSLRTRRSPGRSQWARIIPPTHRMPLHRMALLRWVGRSLRSGRFPCRRRIAQPTLLPTHLSLRYPSITLSGAISLPTQAHQAPASLGQ